ncbi:UBX domain-containing protein 11 [Platysternon megacephalum]|uniref:UBX domain-containing protein 11 n=1 Tax=Platysternon megacephalum TaxID=55544 RepID=A0A4D9F8L0_9SAUR|nr:UBX domain-containing protein 11 [Platysternon megacephalum]
MDRGGRGHVGEEVAVVERGEGTGWERSFPVWTERKGQSLDTAWLGKARGKVESRYSPSTPERWWSYVSGGELAEVSPEGQTGRADGLSFGPLSSHSSTRIQAQTERVRATGLSCSPTARGERIGQG